MIVRVTVRDCSGTIPAAAVAVSVYVMVRVSVPLNCVTPVRTSRAATSSVTFPTLAPVVGGATLMVNVKPAGMAALNCAVIFTPLFGTAPRVYVVVLFDTGMGASPDVADCTLSVPGLPETAKVCARAIDAVDKQATTPVARAKRATASSRRTVRRRR